MLFLSLCPYNNRYSENKKRYKTAELTDFMVEPWNGGSELKKRIQELCISCTGSLFPGTKGRAFALELLNFIIKTLDQALG